MADSKLTALTEVSVPDLNDDVYLVDDTGPTSYKCGTDRLFGLSAPVPGGRLTTETGVGVSTSDRTAQGTLYYTGYNHNRIRIYDGTRWRLYSFTERSLALTATSGKNYDVFIYDNAGTLTLELSAAWTNDTTRADALTTQDGVYVKSGATTRLWLGTIRASGANVIADADATRYVWNKYNQVARSVTNGDGTNHTYNSATVRYVRGVTTQAQFVIGELQAIACTVRGNISNGAGGYIFIATPLDWTSGYGAPGIAISAAAAITMLGAQTLGQNVPAGYHYYACTEADVAGVTSTVDNMSAYAPVLM